MIDTLNRHQKIALQLSGGKDSLACFYLLKEHLDRITVYWCNTGAAYPETLAIIDHVKTMAPNFVEIEGNQPEVVRRFGLPSDLVPVAATEFGRFASGSDGPIIQDRYACCSRTMMIPTHERMKADGITLIIRGQKSSDRLKSTVRSGEIHDGIEFLFPVEGWSAEEVMTFLKKEGAPISRCYEMLNGTPDCMTCSAWWEEGAAHYLKRYHPDAYAEVQSRLDLINEAVAPHIAAFNKELA